VEIRRASAEDRDALLAIWQRSAKATHAFVSAADLDAMIPQVRDYLAADATDFWVLCDADGMAVGFMGMSGNDMESLFVAPESQGKGGGTMLVRHAQSLHAELAVEVNEQNSAAHLFYKACGFVVTGRSGLDRQGRPYPLLHLRWVRSKPSGD
jgi:putative acetyltransferase